MAAKSLIHKDFAAIWFMFYCSSPDYLAEKCQLFAIWIGGANAKLLPTIA
ncbi:hypothetical protein [Paenibacillus sp. ISL-20]|nr:hypothetical protein [Paenibacillus sp. ISL-20]